ncbi:MAG: hypothetical protein D6805_06340 [Planctomycetota bacterium]|nr:MAG: hypothetical protein D6805_06340 [Planctomycetota bacterium]
MIGWFGLLLFCISGICFILPSWVLGRGLVGSIFFLMSVQFYLSYGIYVQFADIPRRWRRYWVYFFAPGVVLHELSHAVVARWMGGKLERLVLFNPREDLLFLGEVSFHLPLDRWVSWKAICIGLAPYFGCGGGLLALIYFFAGLEIFDISLWLTRTERGIGELLIAFSVLFPKLFFSSSHFIVIKIIWLWGCFSLAQGAAPSWQDLRVCYQVGSRLDFFLAVVFSFLFMLGVFSFFPLVGGAVLLIFYCIVGAQFCVLMMLVVGRWILVKWG